MSLYEIEETLQLLIEAREDIAAEQVKELEAETASALAKSREKRDAVGRYCHHLEAQIRFAKDEEERIALRRHRLEAALDRLKRYVLGVMDGLGVPKLEGNTVTLKKCKNADKVQIVSGEDLPSQFLIAEPVIQLNDWLRLVQELTPDVAEWLDTAVMRSNVTPDLVEIRKALKAGPVSGAEMVSNGFHLEVK